MAAPRSPALVRSCPSPLHRLNSTTHSTKSPPPSCANSRRTLSGSSPAYRARRSLNDACCRSLLPAQRTRNWRPCSAFPQVLDRPSAGANDGVPVVRAIDGSKHDRGASWHANARSDDRCRPRAAIPALRLSSTRPPALEAGAPLQARRYRQLGAIPSSVESAFRSSNRSTRSTLS